MISYEPLWETMKRKGVTQYMLIKKHGISPAQITRLKRNESVSTHTIDVGPVKIYAQNCLQAPAE